MTDERLSSDTPAEPDAAERVCRGCGEARPIAWYHRDPKSGDGRRRDCRACRSVYQAERRSRAGAEEKARVSACNAAYYAAHRERLRAGCKAWRVAHRDEAIATSRAWRKHRRDAAEWARLSRPGARLHLVRTLAHWRNVLDKYERIQRRMNALRVDVLYVTNTEGGAATAVDRVLVKGQGREPGVLRTARGIVGECERDLATFERLKMERDEQRARAA